MNRTATAKDRIKRRNRRILVIGWVFSVLYLIIGVKAFYVQIIQDADLSKQASGEYTKAVKSTGRRGIIYDVNMKELVVSTRITSVGAHPQKIEAPQREARSISKHLDLSESAVRNRLSRDAKFVWIDRDASPLQAKTLKSLDIKGLEFIPGFCRVYPNKKLAAQVLGFAGVDGNGLEGLEYFYDDYLRGNQRQSTIIKDALGRIFHTESGASPDSAGKNLILTIDANVQFIAQRAVSAAVKEYGAKSGMAVVMEPQTGSIRAIAHYPSFDPNKFGSYSQDRWRNRAITDSFEPGSVMKVFMAAAALESGICSPYTMVDCENGSYYTGGHVIHDTHPHEHLTLKEVIQFSSNIGATKIAERVGPERLYETLRAFGFGEKTGIDCPGETSGRLRHYQGWRKIDHATIAFGQGVSVTAVQLISAISAIANQGVVMKPRIVKAISDENGKIIETHGPETRGRAISARTAKMLKNIMFSVTSEEGTGSRAVPAGYTVCGKTGTAQKINARGTYENCEYNAVFVGFSPKDAPKLAAVVVIDEPQKHHYGGVVAAPAFRQIMLESFNYMDIAPYSERKNYNVSVKPEKKGA
ncbi:MAG: penicillin-binding protein 2 [Desulfobacterales bacterium]|nr:penicillin-binding protein 2 [Desulfobacterales bacterium]